jgi:hypothetical protein
VVEPVGPGRLVGGIGVLRQFEDNGIIDKAAVGR